MVKKGLVIATILVIFTVVSFINSKSKNDLINKMMNKSQDKLIDYDAGFAIFTNGAFRVFTAGMYHNLSSDVFIQADNPNKVHVKKKGVTWNDFFKTLPFTLTRNCLITGTDEKFCSGKSGTLKFYLNGKKSDDLLDRVIQPGDKALITFGNETEEQIKKQAQQIPSK